MRPYGRFVILMAVLMVGLGFAILVKTAAKGGGTVGYALGALFIALGAARIYLQVRLRRGP